MECPGGTNPPPNDPILESRHPKLFAERHGEYFAALICFWKWRKTRKNIFFFFFFQFSKLCDKKWGLQNTHYTSQQIAWGVYFPKWGHLGGFCATWAFHGLRNCDRQWRVKSKIHALRKPEGGAWFSGSRTRLGSQKVSHMWYPRTQEKQQNVFWGVISHIPMACLSNISFSDNFVQKKKKKKFVSFPQLVSQYKIFHGLDMPLSK